MQVYSVAGARRYAGVFCSRKPGGMQVYSVAGARRYAGVFCSRSQEVCKCIL